MKNEQADITGADAAREDIDVSALLRPTTTEAPTVTE